MQTGSSSSSRIAIRYKLTEAKSYHLYELTDSFLNLPLTVLVKSPKDEPGPHRLTRPFHDSNYGLIGIDWLTGEISLKLVNERGETVQEQVIALRELKGQPFQRDTHCGGLSTTIPKHAMPIYHKPRQTTEALT